MKSIETKFHLPAISSEGESKVSDKMLNQQDITHLNKRRERMFTPSPASKRSTSRTMDSHPSDDIGDTCTHRRRLLGRKNDSIRAKTPSLKKSRLGSSSTTTSTSSVTSNVDKNNNGMTTPKTRYSHRNITRPQTVPVGQQHRSSKRRGLGTTRTCTKQYLSSSHIDSTLPSGQRLNWAFEEEARRSKRGEIYTLNRVMKEAFESKFSEFMRRNGSSSIYVHE